MQTEPNAKKNVNPKVASSHIQYELLYDLVEKVVCATDIEEKIKWCLDIIKECDALSCSDATKEHIEKCKKCQDFLRSRKLLAALVIQGGRV